MTTNLTTVRQFFNLFTTQENATTMTATTPASAIFSESNLLTSNPASFMTTNPTTAKPASFADTMPQPFGTILQQDNHEIKRILYKQGRESAKVHNADLRGLHTCLETVFEGYKHANTQEWEPGERERTQVEGQMEELKNKNIETAAKLERIAHNLSRKVEDLRERLKEVRSLLKNVMQEQLDLPPSGGLMLVLTGSILLPLTVALYVFYVNVSYRAFFPPALPDNADSMDALGQILKDGGIFDKATFWAGWEALYPALFPVILIALGIGLHLIMDDIIRFTLPWQKWATLTVLMLVTFGLDLLVAVKIHEHLTGIQEMMGHTTEKWYAATNVWIVIMSGFVAFLVWSLVLHGVMVLIDSANPAKVREKKRRSYAAQMGNLEAELKAMEAELEREREVLEQVMSDNRLAMVRLNTSLLDKKLLIQYSGQIKLCLLSYFEGWLSYVTALHEPSEPQQEAFNLFIDSHFTTEVHRDA